MSKYIPPENYLDRAQKFTDLKQYDNAIEVLDEAVKVNPGASWIQSFRIMVYWLSRQYEKTSFEIHKFLGSFDFNSDDHDFYYWVLGECYLRIGEYNSAITAFNETFENGYMDDLPFTGRGIAYLENGQLEKAITDFNLAISINSNRPANYYHRAKYYVVTGNNDLAVSDLKKSIELASANREKNIYLMSDTEILEAADKKLKVLKG